MFTIVDIQGFVTDRNDFIPKEIAVQCDKEILVLLIKPPYPYEQLSETEKVNVDWVQENRKIMWNEGFVKYENYKACIQFLRKKIIFVKGWTKAAWLVKVLYGSVVTSTFACNACFNIHDLEEYGCPSFLKLYNEYKQCEQCRCPYHGSAKCAKANVNCMILWCAEHHIFYY